MRFLTFILTLILIAACAVLNVLGYNGSLSKIEYILVSGAAELLLCLLLGHFMYRTYANHKRAKNQAQELTNAQAALALAQENTAAANAAAASAQAERKDALAQLQATRAEAESSAQELAELKQRMQASEQTQISAPAASATRPLPKPETAAADPDATTLYKNPLA